VLTLRTGNAWVHVWAYHAISPHTIVDTPLIAKIFRIGWAPGGREAAHRHPGQPTHHLRQL